MGRRLSCSIESQDPQVCGGKLDVLRQHGHEGVHAHAIGQDCATDQELMTIARREGHIIVTCLSLPNL